MEWRARQCQGRDSVSTFCFFRGGASGEEMSTLFEEGERLSQTALAGNREGAYDPQEGRKEEASRAGGGSTCCRFEGQNFGGAR